MRSDCECSYCKNRVDEFFCAKCFYNFNKCESFHECEGITLCPRCHPEGWVYKSFPGDPIIEMIKDHVGEISTIEGDYRESMQAWRKFYQDAQHGIVNHQKCEEGIWKMDLGKNE